MRPQGRRIILSCTALVLIVILVTLGSKNGGGIVSTVVDSFPNEPPYTKECRTVIQTPRGFKTYKEIEENVFKPLGYKIREETFIPALDYIEQPKCPQVFTDWLAAGSETQDESAAPPKEIPAHLVDKFTFNNYTSLIMAEFWRDERSGVHNVTWTESHINKLLKMDILDTRLEKYKREGRAVYFAMRNNVGAINGKKGAVIGSTQAWVEIYAMKLGASHVITMEYMKIITKHPRMSYEHPVQVAKKYARHIDAYDWIATYSSLEHSGLGRYGDALDPIGDLKESMKMYCMLNKGGYLFLGLPMGYDTIYFNWHRIYGRIRLALMLTGFDLVEFYYSNSRFAIDGDNFIKGFAKGKPGAYRQPVMVLRKRWD